MTNREPKDPASRLPVPCLKLSLVSLALAMVVCGCASEDALYDIDPAERQKADEFEDGADRPPTPKTLHTLARIFSSQGKESQAEYVLIRTIREYPFYMSAYNELAELHMRNDRLDEAMKVLSIGLRMSPSDPVLLNNLGMSWMLKGDHAKALENFTAAAAARPNDARYRGNMAAALGMLGRYEESLALYEQILPPRDAHHNLAVICDARNDLGRAKIERQMAEERPQVEEDPYGSPHKRESQLP